MTFRQIFSCTPRTAYGGPGNGPTASPSALRRPHRQGGVDRPAARPLLPSPGRPGALAAPGQGGQASRTPCPSAQVSGPPRRSDAGSSGALSGAPLLARFPGPAIGAGHGGGVGARAVWPHSGGTAAPPFRRVFAGRQRPANYLRYAARPGQVWPGPFPHSGAAVPSPPLGGAGPVAPPAGGRPALPRFGSGPPGPCPRTPGARGGAPPPAAGGAPPPVLSCGLGLLPRSCCLAAGLPPAGVPPAGVPPGGGSSRRGFLPAGVSPPPVPLRGRRKARRGAGPIWGGLAWILAGTPACQGQGLRRLRPLDRLEPPPLLGSQGRLRGEVYHRST